ncbi:MAG: efflux RND transporter periplasmic adaptor subunit [Lutibacter sp.]
MRTILTIILGSLILISCGDSTSTKSVEKTLNSNNIKTIIKKRDELLAKQEALSANIQKLNNKIEALDTTKKIPLITSIVAKEELYKHFLELQGNVTTKNLVVIYPEYSGTLTQVFVKEGQKVSKGQLLAKIDDGGLRQQLVQIQIQADLAKTTFDRQQRLWNQKIGSEIQYLQAKTNFEAQQKVVEQLKKQVAKTEVRAPFSGVIDDVITEQGTVVAPGQSPLFRIVNLNNMYIETEIPEKYVSTITKNKDVQVTFPILGTTVNTKIRQTSNYINPANRTFKAEIGIPNKNHTIKPNLTAKLKINDYINKNAILIPLSIISEDANGKQYIYAVTNKNAKNEGIAKRVYIETGYTQGDVIEITNGLKPGMEIIDEGARNIREGQSVKIINL